MENEEKNEVEINNSEENTNNIIEDNKLKEEYDELEDRYKRLFAEFENYKKSTAIRKIVAEVNRLESDGVNLYTNAIRKLYTSSYSPTEIYAWTVVFDHMQQCCDTCEQASESVETIIMKNS